MRQIPTQVFDGFAARNRIVLKIEKGDIESTTKIVTNAFAKPQTVAVVGGKTDKEIIAQLKENKAKIIDAFTKEEVKEKQRRIKLSLLDDTAMETKLGITINIPDAYRISKADDDFFWIRKNIKNNKTIELMLYEVPFETISVSDSTIVDIIKMRDEITKSKIPGEDGIYMAVEDAYAAYLWLADNAQQLKTDGTRIAIAGDSAGEGLAKVLAEYLSATHDVSEVSRTDAGPDAFYATMAQGYRLLGSVSEAKKYAEKALSYATLGNVVFKVTALDVMIAELAEEVMGSLNESEDGLS